MPEYLAPGVYVEEISTGPKPIEGVSTSVAGFLGRTERGPEDIHYLSSWLAFTRWYGGHVPITDTFMVHAVQGFFDNGGQRCFVGRIASATATGATLPFGNMTIHAVGRGAWGNRVFVRVEPASQVKKQVAKAVEGQWVRLQVIYFRDPPPVNPPVDPFNRDEVQNKDRREPDAVEDYDNLSFDPKSQNYVVTAVNFGSRLIRIDAPPAGQPPQVVGPTAFVGLAGGGDGADLTLADYQGRMAPNGIGLNTPDLLGIGRGFEALDAVDEVSLVLAPDQANNVDLTNEVVKRCEQLKERFAVLSVPQTFAPGGADAKPSVDTTFGAQYYPWIKVYDPYSRDDVLVPPAGHMAGIIARTDLEQGVHKAPANAVVIGAKALMQPVTKEDQMLLNPVGINCIRDFRSDGRGIRLWGARTMTSDPEWKYVNVRRLFLFIEESIDEGTQWVVFEPNVESTWARVVRSVTAFLTTIWRNGGLMGTTPDEAFFVKCDRTTMTQDDIDNGRLICYIGVAPVKPAEFVIFRIGQKTLDARG